MSAQPMSAQPIPFYTPEEYVALEDRADFKSEYLSGQIFAMAGGTPKHSAIIGNVNGVIWSKIHGGSCQVFNSDLRVTIMQTGLKTYPDVTVVCGEVYFHPLDQNSIINPTVIFEVLSPSTEAYDRGEKWAHYRNLESLQEYVLVSQDKPRVEHYARRDDGSWKFTAVDGVDAQIALPTLHCTLALAEVYDKIEFAAVLEQPGEDTHAK